MPARPRSPRCPVGRAPRRRCPPRAANTRPGRSDPAGTRAVLRRWRAAATSGASSRCSPAPPSSASARPWSPVPGAPGRSRSGAGGHRHLAATPGEDAGQPQRGGEPDARTSLRPADAVRRGDRPSLDLDSRAVAVFQGRDTNQGSASRSPADPGPQRVRTISRPSSICTPSTAAGTGNSLRRAAYLPQDVRDHARGEGLRAEDETGEPQAGDGACRARRGRFDRYRSSRRDPRGISSQAAGR